MVQRGVPVTPYPELIEAADYEGETRVAYIDPSQDCVMRRRLKVVMGPTSPKVTIELNGCRGSGKVTVNGMEFDALDVALFNSWDDAKGEMTMTIIERRPPA